MKYILLFLISISANAECLNNIAKSEVQDAIALVPGAGAKSCSKEDPCICFDGIYWDAAEFDGDSLSNNKEKLAEFNNKVKMEKSKIADFGELKEKIKEGTADANDKEEFLKKLAGK